MRVLVAEDSVLFREGLVRLLREAGHEVVAEVGDAREIPPNVRATAPDLCVVDIRMPPDLTDDGIRAAVAARSERPGLPVLLLSQHVVTGGSLELLRSGSCGYLLKDRVLRVGDFLDAVDRVAAGGTALDPEVVAELLAPRPTGPTTLTPREEEVLAAAAEGHSNAGIARRLHISERTVETHLRSVFGKLGIPDEGDQHRRVLAVLSHLRTRRGL